MLKFPRYSFLVLAASCAVTAFGQVDLDRRGGNGSTAPAPSPLPSPIGAGYMQYGGNAQHTGKAPARLQPLDRILWSTPIDYFPQYSGPYLLWHYTPPFVSKKGNVIIPVKTTTTAGWQFEGRNGDYGNLMWTMPSDWVGAPTSSAWKPTIGAGLVETKGLSGKVGAVIAGSGGKLLFRLDADSPISPVKTLHFAGTSKYFSNKAALDSTVYINTPITIDREGNFYFGFRVTGTNPLGLVSGMARVSQDGRAVYRSVAQMTMGASTGKLQTQSAIALSNDEKTAYFAVNGGTPYIVAVDTKTLAPRAKARLVDPMSGNNAFVTDQSTSSPTVAPDGHVFFGILENPLGPNIYRGFMLHFDSNLVKAGAPGAFGWDDTPSIVPSRAVRSYTGASNYLLLTKYNNYYGIGGDGVNKLAIVDPTRTMIDPQTGQTVMQTVLEVAGVTTDAFGPPTVREWCVNTVAVDVEGMAAFVNCEDGICYRWDFTTNTLQDPVVLTAGIGEAYTSTIIDQRGRGYAINDARVYVVGTR